MREREATVAARPLSPDVVKDVEFEVTRASALLVQLQAREQPRRHQATDVGNLMTVAPNRWSDFNGCLDDAERSLPSATAR